MIYCVEDEKNIRELLVYTLETTGFTAKGFADGKELKAALKEEIPNLILLDIMLPGDDGYTILGKLKSSPDTKSIPVIMVTAKEAEYDKVRYKIWQICDMGVNLISDKLRNQQQFNYKFEISVYEIGLCMDLYSLNNDDKCAMA